MNSTLESIAAILVIITLFCVTILAIYLVCDIIKELRWNYKRSKMPKPKKPGPGLW